MTSSWKTELYYCYIKRKNVNQKRKNWIFEEKNVSFSFSKDHSTQKLVFVAKKCDQERSNPRACTQTHTKVNWEDTLSGFPECFLQSVIKDRSNMNEYTIGIHIHHIRWCCNLASWTMVFNPLELFILSSSWVPLNLIGSAKIEWLKLSSAWGSWMRLVIF